MRTTLKEESGISKRMKTERGLMREEEVKVVK